MDEQMTTQITTKDRYTVVTVSGEIDLAVVDRLRQTIDTAMQNGDKALILDLSSVGFLDSTGINVLVGAAKRMHDTTLRVVAPAGQIRKVFVITGIDRIVDIYDSLADATEYGVVT